jgi:hypothetical protein
MTTHDEVTLLLNRLVDELVAALNAGDFDAIEQGLAGFAELDEVRLLLASCDPRRSAPSAERDALQAKNEETSADIAEYREEMGWNPNERRH